MSHASPPPEPARGGLRHALLTLQVPHFAPLFGSNFVQAFCGQIMMMAMQWLTITQLTDSRALYFWIPFLQGGVAALLSPFAGAVADRISKRSLLIAGRLLLVVIVLGMATLVQTDQVQLIHVYIATTLGGVISAMMLPAGQTYVFDVVGRDKVESAISLNATVNGIAQVAGPAAAAVLLAWVGVAGSFFIGAAGLTTAAGLLLAIPIAGKLADRAQETSVGQDLMEGLRWAHGDAPVRLVLIACTMAIFNGALGPMRPVFANSVLGVGEAGFGAMGAAAGAGTILAATWLASLASFRKPGLWIIGSLWAYACCILLYALAFSFEWILLIEFFAGFSGQVWNVTVVAGIQLAVPEHMRGRMIGLVFMVAQLGFIGAPAIGYLADAVGDQLALGVFGLIPSVVLALVLAFGHRTLARMGGRPTHTKG